MSMKLFKLLRHFGARDALRFVPRRSEQKVDVHSFRGTLRCRIPQKKRQINGSTGVGTQIAYGYRVASTAAGGLWAEFFPMTFSFPGTATANIFGSVSFTSYTATPGLRFMRPVNQRLSIYGVAGGGYGQFQYAVVNRNVGPPVVQTIHTTHGVFDFGGGLDVRLTQRFSFRTECRDFVTGKGLSGVPGRHHLVPLAGVAMHF